MRRCTQFQPRVPGQIKAPAWAVIAECCSSSVLQVNVSMEKKSSQVKVLIQSKSDRPPGRFGCIYSIIVPGKIYLYIMYMCISQMDFIPETNGTATVLTLVAAC